MEPEEDDDEPTWGREGVGRVFIGVFRQQHKEDNEASALLASGVVALKVIMDIPRLLDVPLLHFGNATLAFNLVGFSIPVFISVKTLLQKRIPVNERSKRF